MTSDQGCKGDEEGIETAAVALLPLLWSLQRDMHCHDAAKLFDSIPLLLPHMACFIFSLSIAHWSCIPEIVSSSQ